MNPSLLLSASTINPQTAFQGEGLNRQFDHRVSPEMNHNPLLHHSKSLIDGWNEEGLEVQTFSSESLLEVDQLGEEHSPMSHLVDMNQFVSEFEIVHDEVNISETDHVSAFGAI